MISLLLCSAALAADPGIAPEHGVAFRYRFMNVPGAILDIWLHDGTEDPSFPERPGLYAHVFGLDYTLQRDRTGITVYAERVRSGMEEGYFDDKDDGAEPDYTDGDYIRPYRFGLAGLGVDVTHHAPLIDNAGELRWELLFGAGLGVGFLTGELQQWDSHIDEDTGDLIPAYDWVAQDPEPPPDGTFDLPLALPLVDIVIGTRFLIKDHYSLRLEGGLHDFVYGSASVGYVF